MTPLEITNLVFIAEAAFTGLAVLAVLLRFVRWLRAGLADTGPRRVRRRRVSLADTPGEEAIQ